ncbi:hypothetical protein TKK_0011786 [Trichogramma kaykai]|uniref:Uncharacterized protein n=1 Tax=Trichogramma kaykai TaxID=54128 RepID=A0ABD2WQE1_9HYME
MAHPDNLPVQVDPYERSRFFDGRSVNWYSSEQRGKVIRRLVERRPNLRRICRPDEIDLLLYDCVEEPYDLIKLDGANRAFIDYVIASGYEDEPVISINPGNRANEPRLFPRVTALHPLAEYYYNVNRPPRTITATAKYLLDVARQLFRVFHRGDFNCVDIKTGWTHLHAACVFGFVEQVRRFLDRGQDPNCRWRETQDTLLHVAARYGNRKMMELLMSRGAKPTLLNNEKLTPLEVFLMAKHGDDVESVWMMLEAGRDEFEPDKLHECLRWAVINHLPNVTKLLLSNGADPTFDLYSRPTKNYIRYNDRSTLSLMFENFDDHKLLAMLSIMFGQRLLTVDSRDDSRHGRADPLLHMALASSRLRGLEHDRCTHTRIAWMLLKLRADPNAVNAEARTALHVICDRYQDGSSTKWFFDAIDELGLKLDIDARDSNGCTALHLAVQGRRLRSAELLLQRGADPNPTRGSEAINVRQEQGDTRVWSPLHYALSRGDVEVAELLLRNGADPNAANAEGLTPLLVICRSGCPGYTWHDGLLERFFQICDDAQLTVRLDVADNEGRTPLQWAVSSLRMRTIDVLLDRGADLASFVFPNGHCFEAHFNPAIVRDRTTELQVVANVLRTIERLESRGYDLKRSDALTIMNLFDLYAHRSEQLTRRFFRTWAIECLMELTGFRLPLECYEMIVDKDSIANADLSNICLATAV